jgi:hypothetical protein
MSMCQALNMRTCLSGLTHQLLWSAQVGRPSKGHRAATGLSRALRLSGGGRVWPLAGQDRDRLGVETGPGRPATGGDRLAGQQAHVGDDAARQPIT